MHIGFDTYFLGCPEVLHLASQTGRGVHEIAMRLILALGWGDSQGDPDGLVRGLELQALVMLYPDTDLEFWQAVERTGLIREVEAGLQFKPQGWVWETRRRGG